MTHSVPDPEGLSDHNPDRVHTLAEQIAVPEFDYIGEPIGAVIDAATGHAPNNHAEPNAGGDAGAGTGD